MKRKRDKLKTDRLTIRIPHGLKMQIKEIAKSEGKTVTGFLEEVLDMIIRNTHK